MQRLLVNLACGVVVLPDRSLRERGAIIIRPYIGATVLVSEHNPDPFYRGKRGTVINIGERWGFVRVEVVIDGVTYKPLIQRGYLEVVKPESFAQGTCPNCGHDFTAHSAWIRNPGDKTCETFDPAILDERNPFTPQEQEAIND